MKQRRWRRGPWKVAGGAMCLLAAWLVAGEAPPTSGPATRAAGDDAADAFFAGGRVPRLRIEIAPPQMEALRKDPRIYARGTVIELADAGPDERYPDIGARLKARWGSFRAIDDHPAFTLDFGRFAGQRSFHGLEKFHLNNSVQDPSYLSENLGRRLFRAAGVPTPRAGHAQVWLNDKDMGFYVLVEGMDRAFLKRAFGQRDGIVFEGALQDIDQPLDAIITEAPTTATTRPEPGSPEEAKLRADAKAKALVQLKRLQEAASHGDAAERRRRLEEVLDIDRFLTFMAMEALTAHWDGYCNARNNYRIYADPKTGKFVFMPHGMDQLFQQTDFPLFAANTIVARAVIEPPDVRARYLERIAQLRQQVFTVEAMNRALDQIAAGTLPALQRISPDAARQHQQQLAGFRHRVADRVRSVDRQLAAVPRPVRFDGNGIATTSGWALVQQQGQAALDQVADGERKCLRIRGVGGAFVASLRTAVLLPKGTYVFEGQCRVAGVAPADDPASGLVLRISGVQPPPRRKDAAWTRCEFAFEVAEPSRDVVLVCEFRAQAGEAWFDTGSLLLRRR